MSTRSKRILQMVKHITADEGKSFFILLNILTISFYLNLSDGFDPIPSTSGTTKSVINTVLNKPGNFL